MSESPDLVPSPIAISVVAGRFLLFDVDVVTYLRRAHHICGVLTGTIPQVPQQNVFLGLPLELMPEEARLLVKKKVAYIVDDNIWHKEMFSNFEGSDRRRYLDSLRSEGLAARKFSESEKRKASEKALAKVAARKTLESSDNTVPDIKRDIEPADSLFHVERPASPASVQASPSDIPWAVTPATTYPPLPLPQNPILQSDVPVPSSYSLFAYLHSKDYFLMPGLRFGCDYNVYPGDPLRFHSHFAAVSYGWDEEISMLDLIGGGRLGTRVKKGFLIGGEKGDAEEEGDNVRTFCIEWGGM